ncbi:MAG TPA: 2,3-bisphosphoglycerate-independent phosphoglycerate mutase [Solirubrobacteraceae bacterium]|nr:2,3-bisphosphoglycerate-independent phosphoglycerate mutase [Solirubrobacteraceae bacterium]
MLPPGPQLPDIARVCLVVMDGWGIAPPGPANAITLADTPVYDELWSSCPHAELEASGRSVGLPAGQMGNSEVGHLTLGAGAAVPQTLTLIDDAVTAGLDGNAVLRRALTGAERVHLLGMVSDGGVHSQLSHLRALVELAARMRVPDLVVHCFTDGRDTPPTTGAGYVAELEDILARAGVGRVAGVVGRYYGMDRDRRWERTQLAYDLIVHGRAPHHSADGAAAVRAAYARGETDEFITPTAVGAEGRIRAQDSVICFNFRPDRMRQIVRALADPQLGAGEPAPGWRGREGASLVTRLTTMTRYQRGWPYPVAFTGARPATTLGEVLESAGISQLHVAETEKYAHVTYFFNGGREQPYEGERRCLVPSRRDVPTYDHRPQMSAEAITDAFVSALAEDHAGFAVINFANADMVGHTGVLPAAVTAVETVDRCLKRVVAAVHGLGGACVITADHGNAECMADADGAPVTTHSVNPVPLIVTARGVTLAPAGTLADVAPTILALLGMAQPQQMTGHSLLAGGVVV